MAGDGADTRPAGLLHIYLNDHRAAGTGERAVLRRMLASNAGTSFHPGLQQLEAEVAEDVRSIDEVMRALDVRPNYVKRALVRVGERLGRLKLNGSLRQYSPLSRVLELEGLQAAAVARQRLWAALGQLASEDPTLARFDLDRLQRRAEDQVRRLEELHQRAVPEALAAAPAEGAGAEPLAGVAPSGGGPGVTPSATTPGAPDTSVFEPPEGGGGLAAREAQLQSIDEDTIPPAT